VTPSKKFSSILTWTDTLETGRRFGHRENE
jgi:hypothetical protein